MAGMHDSKRLTFWLEQEAESSHTQPQAQSRESNQEAARVF